MRVMSWSHWDGVSWPPTDSGVTAARAAAAAAWAAAPAGAGVVAAAAGVDRDAGVGEDVACELGLGCQEDVARRRPEQRAERLGALRVEGGGELRPAGENRARVDRRGVAGGPDREAQVSVDGAGRIADAPE